MAGRRNRRRRRRKQANTTVEASTDGVPAPRKVVSIVRAHDDRPDSLANFQKRIDRELIEVYFILRRNGN